MRKYRGKYRIDSNRLKEWDYSSAGLYYVTICAKDKRPYFGLILEGEVQLSDIGEIAFNCWMEIPEHFSNVEIDEFVVMSNHVHGIVVIEEPRWKSEVVETLHATSLRTNDQSMSKISPKPHTLSTIIRSYKSAVTRQVRLMGEHDFAWQSRFYDHIIRNDEDLGRIRKYIQDNPIKWELDEYHFD